MNKLNAILGYTFRNPELLKQALRHCSAGRDHNERLEFLGDAVLGLIVSELLYLEFPDATEGELSRIRASLVQQSTLAEIARSLQLGEHLSLGPGELKTGGANRDSILADALEALISALFLDGGMVLCHEKVESWFSARIKNIDEGRPVKDAKTALQELLQAKKLPLPVYSIVTIDGSDHQQEFTVSCTIELLDKPVTGCGTSRKEAEQNAARDILEQVTVHE